MLVYENDTYYLVIKNYKSDLYHDGKGFRFSIEYKNSKGSVSAWADFIDDNTAIHNGNDVLPPTGVDYSFVFEGESVRVFSSTQDYGVLYRIELEEYYADSAGLDEWFMKSLD